MFYVMVSVILQFAVRMLWRRSSSATRGIRQSFLNVNYYATRAGIKKVRLILTAL